MRNKLSILSKHLAILSLLMIATIVGTTFMTSDTLAQADPNEILDPEPFVLTYVNSPEPHYVGVMEYGEATFIINGDTLTTRAYRQEGGHVCHSWPDHEHGAREQIRAAVPQPAALRSAEPGSQRP